MLCFLLDWNCLQIYDVCLLKGNWTFCSFLIRQRRFTQLDRAYFYWSLEISFMLPSRSLTIYALCQWSIHCFQFAMRFASGVNTWINFYLLAKRLSHCRVHIYADDVHILPSSLMYSLSENIARHKLELHRIHYWTTGNGLCLNPTKSQWIIVGRRALNSTMSTVVLISSSRINILDVARSLGIILYNWLPLVSHINALVGQTAIKIWPQYFIPPTGGIYLCFLIILL